VTRWSDVRPGWPTEPVTLFGPGAASGTFDYFTEAVVGRLRASRKDYTASEDDGVIVNGVAANPNALGYVGYGHFHHNAARLQAVAIAGPHVDRLGAVLPSVDNVQRGAYAPLSRPLLIYVNAKSLDRPAMADFVNFYLKQDADIVRQVGGIPMSARAYELVRSRVVRRIPGTLFETTGDTSLELLLAQAQ
jgi:phosphate transport system substrate-binding protein